MQQDQAKNGLEYFSMGKVAEHLKPNQTKIEVVPIDQQPFTQGNLVADAEKITATTSNVMGDQYTTSTLASKAITADWIGDSGNRVSAPDVRRGDEVRLYRNVDSDQYYWEAVNRDPSRRRLESGIWRFSGTSDENTKELDDSNSYTVRVDAKTGAMTISTSTANGEKAPIVVQLNGKDGVFAIEVGEGNFIEVDVNDKLKFYNSRGTHVELDGDKVTILGAKTVATKAKDQSHSASTNYEVSAKNISLNSNNIKLGTAMTVAGNTWTHAGPMNLAGHVNITQSISLSASVAQQIANLVRPYL